MKKNVFFIILIFGFLFTTSIIYPCTVGVASGKITKDGRPLLWKNRDSSGYENYVRYFISNGYNYLGLFSRGIPSSMYGGMNEKGFAIMNSVAYDKGKTGGNDNGRLMKRALEECGSISEFELLLKRVMGKYDLAANFGVIDSNGGAAIFETSSDSYKRYDADKTDKGYLLRTNFSMSGGGNVGMDRFLREKEIFEKKLAGKKLDLNFILKNVFRDVKDKDGTIFDYEKGYKKGEKRFYYTKNSICRPYSVSSMIFRGVKPNEPEYLSTFYIILGNPLTGSVIPLWVASGDVPKLVGEYKNSKLNFEQMNIYHYLYPHDKKYTLDVSYLAGDNSPNIIKKLFLLEDNILKESEAAIKSWEKSFPGRKTISNFQNYLSHQIYKNYEKINKELYYFNLRKRIKIKTLYKIGKSVISNFLSDKGKIYFITSDRRLNILDIYSKKNRRIKLKMKIGKKVLIEFGYNYSIFLLKDNEIIKILAPGYNKFKIIKLDKFPGFSRYLKGSHKSFFVRVRNNYLIGIPKKNIIVSLDLLKKRILKRAGKDEISGFRDGTISLSLLSNPYSAYKNHRDELIFSDKGNNSIRSLTQSGVVFTILGNGNRGKESGWSSEVRLYKPRTLIEDNNGNIFIITENGLRIFDKDNYSELLIKSKKFKDYKLIYSNNHICFFDSLKKTIRII